MFIVIEGVDGSGKATQTRLSLQNLQNLGHTASTISFPSYGQPSARFVEQFLNGKFGELADLDPQLASMFYTLDRFGQKSELIEKIASHEYVISDRYSISSFIHRGTKFLEMWDEKGMKQFFDRLMDREYTKAWLPKPDLIIFLSLSMPTIKKLLLKKQQEENAARSYIDSSNGWIDKAEQDLHHQELSLKIWKEILPTYFQNYISINCEDESWNILPPELINQKLLETIFNYQKKGQ